MAKVTKSPADPWPKAAKGLEIQLLPGVHQPVEFGAATDMVITGGNGVIIEGSITPSGEPACSMRFHDGCHRLQIIGPLEVRRSQGRGIRITVANDIALTEIYVHDCCIEGIITGSCLRGVYQDITVEDSGSPARGYNADQLHGVYISGNADGSSVERLNVSRVTGSGLQCNGAGMNATIDGMHASEMVFQHCGSGGTPPISLMAVLNSTFENFNIDWSAPSDRWGVCFADGKGQAYACKNVTFQNYTAPRGKDCSVEQGSSQIHQDPGDGWSPDTPPPDPTPPPDGGGPDVAGAQQAISDAQAALVTATTALATATAAVASATGSLQAAQQALAEG